MTGRVVPLCAAAVAAVGLTGCGSSGPSLSTFKTGFKADKVQFEKLGSDLGSAISTAPKRTDAELAAEFGSLASRATQQAGKLRALHPTKAYSSAVASLATNFDTIATDLHGVSVAAAAHNAAAAKSGAETLVIDSGKLKAVDDSLTSRLGLPQSG